jgi:hypothetical protein
VGRSGERARSRETTPGPRRGGVENVREERRNGTLEMGKLPGEGRRGGSRGRGGREREERL